MRGSLIALYYIVAVLLCNVFQMLSLLVFPFSRNIFRKLNRLIAGTYWQTIAFGVDYVMRCHIQRSGDQLPLEENAVLIANHQTMSDIPLLLWVASRTKRLGDLKWFLKDELKYVPGPGWGVKFLDGIFVKRNWSDDKDGILRTFHNLLSNKIPFWVVSFPEGTRMTKEKHAKSVEFAKDRGIHPLEYLLLPRPKGFVATVQGLRSALNSVIDVTICYQKGTPSLVQFFFSQNLPVAIEVKRFPIETLPTTDGDLAEWLSQRFREKDEFMRKSFHA